LAKPVVDFAVGHLRKPTRNAAGEPINTVAISVVFYALTFEYPELASQSPQQSVVKYWLRVPIDDSRKMGPYELRNEASNSKPRIAGAIDLLIRDVRRPKHGMQQK
jgi:hypothetical protein